MCCPHKCIDHSLSCMPVHCLQPKPMNGRLALKRPFTCSDSSLSRPSPRASHHPSALSITAAGLYCAKAPLQSPQQDFVLKTNAWHYHVTMRCFHFHKIVCRNEEIDHMRHPCCSTVSILLHPKPKLSNPSVSWLAGYPVCVVMLD